MRNGYYHIELQKLIGYTLLLTFFIISSFCRAQDVVFEHFLDDKEFSYNSIRDITQDGKGFLWLATFSGVYRFEGKSFKKYQFDPNKLSIPSDDVTSIVYDSLRNCIWAGTDNGLTQFDLLTDSIKLITGKSINTNQEIAHLQIRSILLDEKSNLWVGTKKSGLFVYTNQGECYKIPTPGISYIKTIFKDKYQQLWLGSTSAGIVRIKVNQNYNLDTYDLYRENIPEYPDAEAPLVNFFMESDEGKLFVGSIQGLYYFDELEEKFILHKSFGSSQGDLKNFFTSYLKRSNGEHWFGTHEGIIKVKNLTALQVENFNQFTHKDKDDKSLSNNLIHNLFEDRYGVIWVGSENGLSKFDPFKNQFKPLNHPIFSNLKANAVTSFAESYDHQLLIGNIYEGIVQKKGNTFSHVLPQYRVCSITTKDSITFWIGTWNSELIKFNIKDKSYEVYKPNLQNAPPIYSLAKVSEKLLLVGTYGNGLQFFNTQTGKIYEPNFLSGYEFPENINKIFQDSEGLVWLGTEGGLIYLNLVTKAIVNYVANTALSKLPSNSVKDIVEDKKGRLWVATKKGLCFVEKTEKGNSLATISKMNQWITDIAIDKKGVLWLNINNNRLASYNPQTQKHLKFTVNNGIRTILNSKRGFYFWADSLLYVGGEDGIIYLDPHQVSTFEHYTPPVFSELKVRNEIINPGKLINDQQILDKQIAYTDCIQLNYDNNSFGLSFFSPDYINYNTKLFRYKLAPLETAWIEVLPDQPFTIQYTYLPVGDHTLYVSSRNLNSDWTEPRAITISINPPIWRTYYAYAFYALLVVIALYFWRKNVIRNINLKNALLLEKIKIEKEEVLHNEKLKFFTNISHELKTPLTLILGPVKHLVNTEKSKGVNEMHQLILYNADRLLKLVNQLLDFRKAEEGQLKLRVSTIEIVTYTNKILASFDPMAIEKKITYKLDAKKERIQGWLDIDKYDKILYNLLSNALKYTPEGGEVTLKLYEHKDKIHIEVTDTGLGISKSQQEKIFSRFYQVPNQDISHSGTGIGLSLVKSLVEAQRGEIALKSTEGKGSKFTVIMPFTKHAYHEDELFIVEEEAQKSPHFITKNGKIESSLDQKEKLLLVEDNTELRYFIKNLLQDKYQIFEAANGKEGLSIAIKIVPKLVIADVMMPEMDGFEFCKQLKTHEEISHIPVIILTALGTHEHTLSGYQLGADDYISKPFEPELLKIRINNLIANRALLKKKFQNEMHTGLEILSNTETDKSFLEKLKELIEVYIDDPRLNISFLCSQLNISQSKLYRKLAELTDLKPNDFIKTIRLKKAVLLLQESELTIAEVAYKIGFNDPLYFSKCFKKQFSITPSEVRKPV